MSVRRWKEALGKEGLGNQITRVGEIGKESSVYSIFPPPSSSSLAFGFKEGGVGGRGPTTHTHKNRNNGERDQSRDRI